MVTIVTVAKELTQTLGAARRFFVIEDEPVTVRDGAGAELPNAQHVGIRFDSVTFALRRKRARCAARPSFEVAAGTTVALVGRSGAGKTTAAHLLLRFWDPQNGRILDRWPRRASIWRGRAARADRPWSPRTRICSNTTLRENIRLGRPGRFR